MPTIIGIIFFCLAIYCFIWNEASLFGLLLIATTFEAASAFNIAGRGVQPYYIVALFIIFRAIINQATGTRVKKTMPQSIWLFLFGTIAITSAFILPIVFAGIPIYEPKIGIDDGLFIRPPLSFGLNNLGQAGFLAWHLATAYSVLALDFSASKIRRAYLIAFYFVVLIIFAQSAFQLVGIPFPYSWILNNPGYALWEVNMTASGTRNPGTFTEPSLAGGFLAFYCIGFIAEYLSGKGNATNLLIALLASGAVASSGSLFVLSFVTILLLVRYSPFRFPWYLNLRRAKRIAWILILLVAPLILVLLLSASYRETLMVLTVSKGETSSFFNRTASDLYALQLLLETHWLGVGLGSSRSSSMLTTLLSNIGIAGVLAFGVFIFKLFARLPQEYAWFRWAIFALIFNMCIGIPDVTIPMLWVFILFAIQLIPNRPTTGSPINTASTLLLQ